MENGKVLFLLVSVFLLSLIASAALVDDVITRINDVICIFLCIIWYVFAALATVILILTGIKYMSSESPDERDESRKRIFNAVAGLIILVIAVPLVNYLIQNTNITEFKGCNCVFPPANATTTTTPHGIVTTTPHSVTTPPEDTTTTTFVVATTTTTTTGGTTTTTSGGMITCNAECVIDLYKNGACKDICDSEEIDHGTSDDCSLPKICCCVPFPSTTTTTTTTITTTTTVTGSTTTVITTTTYTTTSTTTTLPCANSKCPDPKGTCQRAEDMRNKGKELCYGYIKDGQKIPGLDDVCGSGYRECCCTYYSPNCCGPPI